MNIPKKRISILDSILKAPTISLYRLITRRPETQGYYMKNYLRHPQKVIYLLSTSEL